MLPNRAQIRGIQINSALRSTLIMVINTKAGNVVCIKKFEIALPSLVLMKPKTRDSILRARRATPYWPLPMAKWSMQVQALGVMAIWSSSSTTTPSSRPTRTTKPWGNPQRLGRNIRQIMGWDLAGTRDEAKTFGVSPKAKIGKKTQQPGCLCFFLFVWRSDRRRGPCPPSRPRCRDTPAGGCNHFG